MKITTSRQMQQLGFEFAQKVKNGGVIALYGNLGAGKTTFVQGLAQGIGVEKRIISPTFIIIRSYQLLANKMFYHIDLYRTNGTEEEVKEIVSNPYNIVAIEWAEKMKQLPQKRFDLHFTYISDTERGVVVKEFY